MKLLGRRIPTAAHEKVAVLVRQAALNCVHEFTAQMKSHKSANVSLKDPLVFVEKVLVFNQTSLKEPKNCARPSSSLPLC